MEKNNNKYFGFVTAVFVAVIFFFNLYHLNQQGTYEHIFRQIAVNLFDGQGYTCDALGGIPLLYPLWGYTGLVLLDVLFDFNNALVLIIQYILCVVVINLFYKIYQINPKYKHLFYFLPFIALMSVKWPDAIVGALLFVYGYFIIQTLKDNSKNGKISNEKLRRIEAKVKWKYIVLTGIVLGVILNFRTEYLFMPLVFLVFILFPQMKGKRKQLFLTTLISSLVALFLLLPWAFRAKSISGDLSFTATNSGAVMYLSMGQLPNNKWGIAPYDKTVYDIADSLGFMSPYSYKANTFFSQKAFNLIANEPFEFGKKMGYNFFSIWKGGVYTGEYANYFISQNRRNEIDDMINKTKGIFNKLQILLKLNLNESIPLITEKFLQAIFIPILFLLLVLFVLSYYKQKDDYMDIVFLVGAAVILYKIVIVCLVQYEYRHINSIYLFLLGTGITSFLPKSKEKQKM